MNPLSTADLVALAEIMRVMASHASDGDWTSLTHLDRKRREILDFKIAGRFNPEIEKLTHNPQTIARNSTISEIEKDAQSIKRREMLVSEIRALDTQIMKAVQLNRQRLIDDNRSLTAQIKAQEVYARACLMS